ncbi:hypothetical protein Mgra_00009697, partial [Meloidogyne graminicola]
RINNYFLLGSPNYGTIPFVQFNGIYIEGTDNIINSLKHLGNNKIQVNKNEIEIIEIIEQILIPILMYDRTTKINGKTGLDFLITDKGIREQLIIYLPQFHQEKQLKIEQDNYHYILIIGKNFWLEYFKLNINDAITKEEEEEIISFMKKFVITPFYNKKELNYLNLDDWERLNKWINELINKLLYEHFIGEGKESWNYKIKQYLNKINFNQSSNQNINYFIELFDEKLTLIANKLLSNGGEFLFGEQITKIDIYLFSVFIQFFEGHLNNKKIKKYFLRESEKINNLFNKNVVGKGKEKMEEIEEIEEEIKIDNLNNNNDYIDWRIEIIYQFIEKIKIKLGFVNNEEWLKLKNNRILNYENENYFNEKYNGPFYIETNELIDIDKLIEYNKYKHVLSSIVGIKRLEKSKSSTNFLGKMKETIKGKLKPEIEDFDELIQKILNNLFNYLNKNINNEIDKKGYGTICLNILAAYLCNLGKNFNLKDSEKCKNKYLAKSYERETQYYNEKINEGSIGMGSLGFAMATEASQNALNYIKKEQKKINIIINKYIIKTKEIASKTIREFNEEKIEINLEKAIKQAWIIKKELNNEKEELILLKNKSEIEEEGNSEALIILGEF